MTEERTATSELGIAFLAGMGVLALALPVAWVSSAFGVLAQLASVEGVVFFGVSYAVLRFARRPVAAYAGLSVKTAWPLGFGFLLGVANFFALVVPVQSLMEKAFHEADHDAAALFRNHSPLALAGVALMVCLVVPFCEELFFRGVLQRGLSAGRPVAGWVAAATLFAAAHLDRVNFLALLELGLVFGLLYRRTGSIWPGAFAHAANNLVSTLLFLADPHAPTNEVPDAQVVLAFGAAGGLALLALWALSRRFPVLLAPPQSSR